MSKVKTGAAYGCTSCDCMICGQPTIMGMHPKCISLHVRRDTSFPHSKVAPLCVTCPFRRGVPPWEARRYVTLNLIRIRLGHIQTCHSLDHLGDTCAGMLACRSGGSGKVVSPPEYADRLKSTTSTGMTSYDEWQAMRESLAIAQATASE